MHLFPSLTHVKKYPPQSPESGVDPFATHCSNSLQILTHSLNIINKTIRSNSKTPKALFSSYSNPTIPPSLSHRSFSFPTFSRHFPHFPNNPNDEFFLSIYFPILHFPKFISSRVNLCEIRNRSHHPPLQTVRMRPLPKRRNWG
jgi:hypothetical protein